MRHLLHFFLTAVFLSSFPVMGTVYNDLQDIPVSYKGRIRPMDTYARFWLYERYGSQKILKDDWKDFSSIDGSALDLLWTIHSTGFDFLGHAPLYRIKNESLKRLLGLDTFRSRFSFKELNIALESPLSPQERGAREEWNTLKSYLQQHKNNSLTIRALPSKFQQEQWNGLEKLVSKQKVNFTAFSNKDFHEIQQKYLRLLQEGSKNISSERKTVVELAAALKEAYITIEGKPYLKAKGKELIFPTLQQIRLERIYYQYPFLEIGISLFIAAVLLLLVGFRITGTLCHLAAVTLLTALLAARCYILQRPPVSNMFETILYVPWFAALAGVLLSSAIKNIWPLTSSAILSTILMALVPLTGINTSMENVQAVLDSQYWLIIHVLMVVGSYGAFLLSGIAGHAYLLHFMAAGTESQQMQSIAKVVLQAMYVGLAMLIPGTILGGVWAAESWGRFWDWDPKESWAFITACVYLIWVHSYTFRRIGNFGLAVGSVTGVAAVSFTWYGVNYILGTGLHSYGFGSGGELAYYIYLGGEGAFLLAALLRKRQSRRCAP